MIHKASSELHRLYMDGEKRERLTGRATGGKRKHIISAKLMKAERENLRVSGCFVQMAPAHRQEMKPGEAALGGCLPGSSGSRVLGSVSTFCPKWLLLGRGFGQTYPGSAAPSSCQRVR